ncbi:MAG: TonB-dependent receptor [Hyphomicrobiales bacterium]
MERFFASGIAAGFFVAALTASTPTFAQSEITVYAPFRGIATPIARAGSSVSVITREEIEQAGQISVAELLRTVPGVSFTGAGGPGSQTDVRIRGTEAQHTMVLIDGVPVSDTTSTRNVFDFRTISPALIERIEVLRGPQSALYGSDAIGGVINIISRQASRGMSGSASVEGGSYGTHREALEFSYGGDGIGILGSVSHSSTEGFSRTTADPEEDGMRQWSGFLRGTMQVNEDLSLDAQFQASDTQSDYDRSPTSGLGTQDRERDMLSVQGHARARHESFDDRWVNTLTLFAGRTDAMDDDSRRITDYEGTRVGADYTSAIDLGAFGSLLVGGTLEEQTAEQSRRGLTSGAYSGSEIYWGAFAMHQFSLTPMLHLSAAVRVDDFDAAGTFVTARGTAVYEIHETETRFHASAGTGAKAATLYQRFGPFGPNPNLLPEESFGADAGVTQVLFDGRATIDITGFYNTIENMIDYNSGWVNISEAETFGVEATLDARLIPGQLDGSAHYTYLVAEDSATGLRLRRRPEHEGQISLTYYGIDRLSITGTATFVGGDHFSSSGETDPLDPYVRFDATASYQAHEHLEIFGRVENLFDADYEERTGYNTPGLSAYAGIRATF